MDHHIAREILGVSATSSEKQVREAYLDLVKVWHPDRFPQGSRLRSKAEEKLKEINRAYSVLATSVAAGRSTPGPPTSQAAPPTPASRPNPNASPKSPRSTWSPRWPSGVWLVGSLLALWWAASVWDSYLSTSALPARVTGGYAPSDIETVAVEPLRVVESEPLTAVPCEGIVLAPKSGTEIGGRHRGGLGNLTIKNGSESDAIAVVIDAASLQPRRAIYIRRGEPGLMKSMPVGTYIVRFQLGETWLAARRFCNIVSTSEFENHVEFTETRTETGTKFSRVELTLYTVQGGNAPTDLLPNDPLPLPEQ